LPEPGTGRALRRDDPGRLFRVVKNQGHPDRRPGRELRGEDEKRARQIYGEKFPIVGPLANVPPAIVKALAKVRWFMLVPERFHFIDNSKGFGHREEIALG
jgi:hypothetical protein